MFGKLEDDENKSYLISAFTGFFTIAAVRWLFPSVIPFSMFEFWHIRAGGLSDWLRIAWPIFAWGAGANLIHAFFRDRDRSNAEDAESLLGWGMLTSLWAGVMEEICFRWLIFMSGIVGVKVTNFFFFGFLGFGVPRWFQLNVLGPLANFATFGVLKDVLVNPYLWAVGAALISANAFFRDGHKYQGWFGILNSWFIGMFLFWVLFAYGLVACIVIHFAYDALITAVVYLTLVAERQFYWGRRPVAPISRRGYY